MRKIDPKKGGIKNSALFEPFLDSNSDRLIPGDLIDLENNYQINRIQSDQKGVKIRIWNPDPYNKKSFGHVALQTYQNNERSEYLSFWPTKTIWTVNLNEAVPGAFHTRESENCSEMLRNRPHNKVIRIDNIDVNKVEDKIKNFKKNIPKWKLLSTSHNTEHNETHCCVSIVIDCLIAGGYSYDFKEHIKLLPKRKMSTGFNYCFKSDGYYTSGFGKYGYVRRENPNCSNVCAVLLTVATLAISSLVLVILYFLRKASAHFLENSLLLSFYFSPVLEGAFNILLLISVPIILLLGYGLYKILRKSHASTQEIKYKLLTPSQFKTILDRVVHGNVMIIKNDHALDSVRGGEQKAMNGLL